MSRQHIYQGSNPVPMIQQREQSIKHIVPSMFIGILGFIQLVLCIIIMILEILNIRIDPGRGTIYAGLWCSVSFLITSLAMFLYLCCGKSNRCQNYLIIQNLISLIFTIILMSFTVTFINNPCFCYDSLCRIPTWDSLFDTSNDNDDDDDDDDYDALNDGEKCLLRNVRKVPLLKGLLACVVLMFTCNIVFAVICTIISIRLCRKTDSDARQFEVIYEQQTDNLYWGERSPFEGSQRENHPQAIEPSAPPPPYETVVNKL